MLRIQYASDFHLELYESIPKFESLLKPCAPYLALAGDIGHPNQLIKLFEWASPLWKDIFYVAGNHEYYGADYTDRHNDILNISSKFKNIHFLNAECPSYLCKDENTVVLGLTLWSHASISSDWHLVSDYKSIKFKEPALNCINKMHKTEKEILDKEITKWTSRGHNICIITHHLPSFKLIHPKHAFSTVNDCFASNCDSLMRDNVRIWIYGHTHSQSKQYIKNTLCVCNPKGYMDENVIGWLPNAYVDLITTDTIATTATTDQSNNDDEELIFM